MCTVSYTGIYAFGVLYQTKVATAKSDTLNKEVNVNFYNLFIKFCKFYVTETELSTKEENKNGQSTVTNDTDNNHEQNKSMEMKKELSKTTATPSIGLRESSQSTCDDYTTYKSIIQDNIEYDPNHPDAKLIDELVDCMLDVICTKGDTVKINGEEKSRNLVKDQYLKINYFDIDHVLYRYKSQHHKIIHLHLYLKTMLYTVKQENRHYYTNAVRADGIVC